jgi:four helix bundle suffix protein
VNVGRASLDELLLDYEDFLRQRGLPQWDKNSRQARAVREVGRGHRTEPTDRTDPSDYAGWLTHPDPTVVANALICLIHQANYLLDRQVAALEQQFVEGGGYSEQLAAARLAQRAAHPTDRTDRSELLACPQCGKPMVVRTARRGERKGTQFLGCSGYPGCLGTRQF